MGGKKKSANLTPVNRRPRARSNKKKGLLAGVPYAGISGLIDQRLNPLAEQFGKKLLSEIGGLAFPTSGARAVASPNLALGYGESMALSAPIANGTYVKHRKARMRTTPTGITVTHREYVQDIVFGDAGVFTNVVDTPINPGNRLLFPWLSGIADRFETYRFDKLTFIYEPQTSTTSEGSIMLAVDFDAVDPPPVDKLQMMAYDGAVRSSPWFAAVYACTPHNLHKAKEYYITRGLTTPLTTDEKTYFLGNLFLACQSQADPYLAGELYVEYTVRLITPQLDSISGDQSFVWIAHQDVGMQSAPAVVTTTGGYLEVLFDSTNPAIFSDAITQFIIPNPGYYHVEITVENVGQNPAAEIYTNDASSLPVGVTMSSTYAIAENLQTNYAHDGLVIANLQGPIWFQVQFIGNVAAAFYEAQIFITPFDQQAGVALGPLMTPPLALSMTRLQRYLALHPQKSKEGGKNKRVQWVAPAPSTVVVEEEIPKELSPTGLATFRELKATKPVAKPTHK